MIKYTGICEVSCFRGARVTQFNEEYVFKGNTFEF